MDTGLTPKPPPFQPVGGAAPRSTASTVADAGEPRGLPILSAFARLGKPMYEGTVPAHVKARRRRQGKAAKRARRLSRG